MNLRIDNLVEAIAQHMMRKYSDVDAQERVERTLKQRINRLKAAIAQIELRAEHWREIAAKRR